MTCLPQPRSRGVGRSASLGAIILALMLTTPGVAMAHAELAGASPADQERLDSPPQRVELSFTGRVSATRGSIQVFAPDEAEVQVGAPAPARGRRIAQDIDAEQTGTYAVSWRVSSEDGHVITGTTTFSVGDATGDRAAAAAADRGAKVDRRLGFAMSAIRFVELLALLVAAGGGMFATVVAPGWRPRLLLPALGTLLVAYACGFVVNAAILGGTTIGGALTSDALRAAADTPHGRLLEIRAIVATVAIPPAALLRQGASLGVAGRAAVAVVFAALAASLSITGHAVTTEPTWLRLPLDMVHVLAAALWIGGLVQLGFLAPFAGAHVESVARFSRLAFAGVITLLATGAYATVAELGMRPAQLLDSTYGRLVVGKLVLYLGTMPLAWSNMTAFVPQVRRRPHDAPAMLRQYVWRELALLLVVLALTAWLIATPPPR